MSIRRLILGFSTLALVIGLAAASFLPGGWFSDWTPGSYYTSGFEGQFNDLLVRLGFAKSTAIPFIGLVSFILGAIGLVLAWAIRPSDKQTDNHKPDTNA